MDESGLADWARRLRLRLRVGPVSLGLVFLSPKFFPHAQQVLEILRVHAQIPVLAGCSSQGLVAGGEEIENAGGLVLCLYSLPGARISLVRFTQQQVEEAHSPDYWPSVAGMDARLVNAWLAFMDPFHMDPEAWLQSWQAGFPGQAVYGGLAGGSFPEPVSQVYMDGEVFEDGGVAVAVGGEVTLGGVVAQGCTPIGETWTLTRVEQNRIRHIGNRPAYNVLVETVNQLSPVEQQMAMGNLFIGLVVDEYLEEFRRGDFLVRNLLDGDPQTGVLEVGALPRAGQTVQFQRRDAAAATQDLTEQLKTVHGDMEGTEIYGGCLFCCNGRGRRFFGRASHDAGLVQNELGPLGLAGFFCNGEIAPIGSGNFVHSHTAALALFVKKEARRGPPLKS